MPRPRETRLAGTRRSWVVFVFNARHLPMPSHNAHAKLEFSGSKSHIAHLAGATRQRKAGFRTGMWTKMACRLLCWWACVYVATADKRACCAACSLRLATCESVLGSGMVPNASRTPPPHTHTHTHTHTAIGNTQRRARARACVCVWVCVWSQNLFNFIHRRYCYYGRLVFLFTSKLSVGE